MEKITVKLNVAGEDYKLVTEDSAAYLTELAREVDLKIAEYQKNPHISTTQAAVLTALEYADKAKKDGSATDNLRAQLKTYLEDAAQAKSERDFYKREVDRIKSAAQANADSNEGRLW
ncbi:MAG: cell division protein ZapA [Clostridia bacterium]|nr:cell division protein ZapA [Clostridia bacterium]